jgi:hypothetical protein
MPAKKNSGRQSVGSATEPCEPVSYAARIRALIEKDCVAQARSLLSEALEVYSLTEPGFARQSFLRGQ